jgi:hypothetical protein
MKTEQELEAEIEVLRRERLEKVKGDDIETVDRFVKDLVELQEKERKSEAELKRLRKARIDEEQREERLKREQEIRRPNEEKLKVFLEELNVLLEKYGVAIGGVYSVAYIGSGPTYVQEVL